MKDEIKFFQKNKTWSLTKLLEGKKVLQNRCVYRLKEESDDNKRYKAKLVVRAVKMGNPARPGSTHHGLMI